MAKKSIKLTESDIHWIVEESVKKILQEKNYRHEGDNFDLTNSFISKSKMHDERSTNIVISRLNQAKRNLVSLKGLYANLAGSKQHTGQSTWRGTNLAYDEIGIHINDAIESINKALENLGFSSSNETSDFTTKMNNLNKKY